MTGFFEEISDLLLSDVRFSYLDDRVEASSLTTGNFRHLFAGAEIVVAGRLASGSTRDSGNRIFETVVDGTAAGGDAVSFKLSVDGTRATPTAATEVRFSEQKVLPLLCYCFVSEDDSFKRMSALREKSRLFNSKKPRFLTQCGLN